jgi:hypothetical protein
MYLNRLEPIDYCEQAVCFEWALQVEPGRGTGCMGKNAGVRIEVVALFRDLEDVDTGVGNGEAIVQQQWLEIAKKTWSSTSAGGWQSCCSR